MSWWIHFLGLSHFNHSIYTYLVTLFHYFEYASIFMMMDIYTFIYTTYNRIHIFQTISYFSCFPSRKCFGSVKWRMDKTQRFWCQWLEGATVGIGLTCCITSTSIFWHFNAFHVWFLCHRDAPWFLIGKSACSRHAKPWWYLGNDRLSSQTCRIGWKLCAQTMLNQRPTLANPNRKHHEEQEAKRRLRGSLTLSMERDLPGPTAGSQESLQKPMGTLSWMMIYVWVYMFMMCMMDLPLVP